MKYKEIYNDDYSGFQLLNLDRVKLDFYADNSKQGYRNRMFSFVINHPNDWELFTIETYFRFKRNGNKIRAMFLVDRYGQSLKLDLYYFNLVLNQFKIRMKELKQDRKFQKELDDIQRQIDARQRQTPP